MARPGRPSPLTRSPSEEVLGLLGILLLPLGLLQKVRHGHPKEALEVRLGEVLLPQGRIHIRRSTLACFQLIMTVLLCHWIRILCFVLLLLFSGQVVCVTRAMTDVRSVHLPFAIVFLHRCGVRHHGIRSAQHRASTLETIHLTSAVIDVGGINLELAILISTTLSDYGPCRCCSIQDGPPARLQVVGIFGAVVDVARVHLPLPILRLLHRSRSGGGQHFATCRLTGFFSLCWCWCWLWHQL
mmetsp:Transcript_13276/g.27792  ORF Transcript_13276/g.27792 Transcript_13276/m.27792 type:complete len:242 (-) Transcript_13276:483-1208(-)